MRSLPIFFLLLMCINSVEASDWSIDIYTEHYPPFNYIENSKPKGIGYDIFSLLLEDLGREDLIDTIAFVPWARGYNMALNEPNTALFSIARTVEREELFQWVGPFMSTRDVLITSKASVGSKKLPFSKEDFADKEFVAVKYDVGVPFLKRHLKIDDYRIEAVSFPSQAALMLEAGRVDFWIYGVDAAQYVMESLGMDPADYQVVYEIDETEDLHFGFSLSTPVEIVELFQQSWERVNEIDEETKLSKVDEVFQRYQSDFD